MPRDLRAFAVASPEALEILKALGEKGTFAKRGGNAEDWRLVSTDGTRRRIAPSAIGFLRAQQWIAERGRRLDLNPAGRQARINLLAAPMVRRRDGDEPIVRTDRNPLERLRARRDADGNPLIGEQEYRAGERLRRDFELSRLRPRTSASWSPSAAAPRRGRKSGGRIPTPDLAETAIAAKTRFFQAQDAVGNELFPAVEDVCCNHLGLEALEARRGWPKRSARIILELGLRRLANHYRGPENDDTQHHALRRWRDPNRPNYATPPEDA